MPEFRDWSVTASANTGTSVAGWMKENINYSEVNDAYREGQAIQARYLADNNGSIVSVAGASSSYSIATNATLSSLQDGDMVRFVAHANNSGASTVAVGETSARPMVAIDGVDLVADAIVAGGTYDLSYRSASAKWQVVNLPPSDLKLNSPTVGTLAVTDTTAIDLSDTDNALNVGTLAGGHIAVDPDSIQAKDSATTPGDLNINALGGNTIIGSQTVSGSGSIDLYQAGVKRVETTTTGAKVFGSILALDNASASANTVMQIRNSEGGVAHYLMADGSFRLYQTDEAGAVEDIWAVGDRNAGFGLRHNNSVRLATTVAGANVTGTVLELDSGADSNTLTRVLNTNGGHAHYTMVTSGEYRLYQTDSSGVVEDIWIVAERNAGVGLRHNNALKLATAATGVSVTGDVSASSVACETLTLGGDSVPSVADFAAGFEQQSAAGSIVVSFGKTFAAAPIVTITQVAESPGGATNANIEIEAGTITTTQFTVYIAGDVPAARRSFTWIAVKDGV